MNELDALMQSLLDECPLDTTGLKFVVFSRHDVDWRLYVPESMQSCWTALTDMERLLVWKMATIREVAEEDHMERNDHRSEYE